MRTLTVVGHGTARAVPDVAVVHVTAVHRARSLSEALAGGESARESIVARARRFTDEVASQHLAVGRDAPDHGAFHARHSLLLRCADLDQAAALLTSLVDEVGDRLQVDHVGLEVSDPTGPERLAREAAFADARARAEHLAAQAGGTVGAVQSVVEGGAGPSARFAMAASVGFEAGETAVEQQLTVTFELL